MRVVHLPTGTTEMLDPIGLDSELDVIAKLTDKLSVRVQKMKAPYSLWRLDDNNNEFMIMKFWLKEAAEDMRRVYENRGHNQIYFLQYHD